MKEFDRARADFQRVTQLYPANKAAKSQIMLCQKHIKEQHEKDKRLYANMFQKFAERDAKVSVYGYQLLVTAQKIYPPNICCILSNIVFFFQKEAEHEKEQEKKQNGNAMEIEENGAQEQTAA